MQLEQEAYLEVELHNLQEKKVQEKPFLALQTAANWQKQDPENCFAFIDCEYTYDTEWAQKFGIDNDRVFYIKTNEAEKNISRARRKIKVNSVTQKKQK